MYLSHDRYVVGYGAIAPNRGACSKPWIRFYVRSIGGGILKPCELRFY
jgi:hypothetical protein